MDDGIPLPGLDAGTAARLTAGARGIAAPAGTILFRPGDDCGVFLIVRRGTVRVQLLSDTGHEIVLYRVAPGETCILTTACLMSGASYGAEGVAETDVEALALPRDQFDALMQESPAFRRAAFAAFADRLGALMTRIDDIAFRSIDTRLARWLVERAPGVGIACTHQEIANELGTAREVVSRRLKRFERDGMVALARGTVTPLDRDALRRLAAGEASVRGD